MRPVIGVVAVIACLVASPDLAIAKDSGKKDKVVGAMVHFGNTLRKMIKPTKERLRVPLQYTAGHSCSYEFVEFRTGLSELSGTMEFKTTAVRDRIAISADAVGAKSSFLISPDGRIANFNAVDPFTKRRTTFKNFEAEAARIKEETRLAQPDSIIQDVLISPPLVPRIVANDGSVGSKVAILEGTNGEWAGYYYQGMVRYREWDAVVLDLIRQSALDGKKYRIGFLVAEYRTMVPLMLVFENFERIRVRINSCSR